ncbi:MAG: VanW family protein [Clostridia bacterium]|nr:VanW family protein [Clostridia bacterium]
MEPEVQNTNPQKSPFKFLSRKAVYISLISFILLMLALTAQFSYMILNYDKIYKGVYVNSIYAGNLSKEDLKELLHSNFTNKTEHSDIVIKCKDITEKLSFKDIKVNYDINKAVELAYNLGRSGNIFERFSDILKARRSNVTIKIPVSYDKDKITDTLQNIYSRTLISVKEADLLVQEDRITIRSGRHGENIDKDKSFREIEESIKSGKNLNLEIPVIITAPSRINVNEYYNQINREVKDATFKIVNNAVEFVPEVIGRSINKDDLESIATELEKAENMEKVLPVSFAKPKITIADIHAKLFKDILCTVKTPFKTNTQNNKNRSVNIKLASSRINGKVLAPDEVFSFNETVGERTKAAGYLDAYVYKKGKVVPDLAGGICQVSSTLYNAVLKSDLDIVERRNHMFIVTYVKPGTDATIFGNTTDFKFKNSTKWPIKIESSITKDNYLVFTIKGTSENPERVIEIFPEIRNKKSFETKYIDDPNMEEGSKPKVLQEGHEGMTVDTYKIIKVNGKVIEKVKIDTSVYQPLTEEIARGTKKAAVPTTTTTQPVKQPDANTDTKPKTDTDGSPADNAPETGNSTDTDAVNPAPDDVIDPGQ